EDGETCNGTEPWSVVLFNFDGSPAVYYSTIEANFVQYPDGSATLTGTVVRNDDPTRGWIISVEFANGMDWNEWSTQAFPTGYKDDCNLSGDNHLDWTYYIMQAGANLTGWGANAGSTLNLSHAPSNYYYGYQVGVAANNVNVQYGSGGWFTYSGIYEGASITGSGDFAFDHDCCPQYTIERTWCAVDCSGNETCFTQVISFEDLGTTPPVVGGGHQQSNDGASKGDVALTKVTNMSAYPNPAIEKAFIEFSVAETGVAKLEVFNMNGQLVAVLFNAEAGAENNYRVELNAAALPTGIYLYQLTTGSTVMTDRLIITK
ncbi:MAG: hypothetical protein RL226_615, partial [Bacteroidota bacterium]